MGLSLSGHVPSRRVMPEDLKGRTVAVDASNVMYTFLTAYIDARTGSQVTGPNGEVTSHLLGLFRRNLALLEQDVRPIYCFDGRTHPLKADTCAARHDLRARAAGEHRAALDRGDWTTARKKAAQAAVLTRDMVTDAKRLLTVLGLPWVQATYEGEAQAIHLANHGHADLVATTDWDALAMGAPVLIRHFTSSEGSRLAPTLVELQEALGALGCTREELVCAAVLMGTDYNDGVKGIGPKKGVKLAREHRGDIAACLRALKTEMPEADEVYHLLLDPPANTVYTVAWGKPDREKALALLLDWGFPEAQVRTMLAQYDLLLDPPGKRPYKAKAPPTYVQGTLPGY